MTEAAAQRAAARPVVLGRLPGARSVTGVATLVLVAAVFAIGHPYLGVVGDAALYLGRSVADLDPAGVGRDIVFANDGQSRFSIFFRLVDPLVAVLGAERAGMVVAAAASACFFGATLALARALGGERRLTIAVALVAATMPTAYGAGIFHFAETNAVPRPFAEAAVMASVAALLAERPLVAGLLLVAALAIHPIMAMAGIGTVLVLVVWRATWRGRLMTLAAVAAAVGLAAVLGMAGVPLLDRMSVRIDPDWLGMLTERSPELFPSLWRTSSFTAPVVQATTIALAVRHGARARRRVLVAIVISAGLQLAAATLFGDAMHGLLAVQGQGWRALWLLSVLGTFCVPFVVSELWRDGAAARLALALLGFAWLCPIDLGGGLAACTGALFLRVRPDAIPIRDQHAKWALGGVASLALLSTAVRSLGWIGFVDGQGRWNGAVALVSARQRDLLLVPSWLGIAAWHLAPPRRQSLSLVGIAVLAAFAIAAATWDERASSGLAGRQDGFTEAIDVPGALSSEILAIGGMAASWFVLHRPQYFSPEQGASIVFSRPLALEWRRRARILLEMGLVPRNVLRPWEPLSPADPVVVTADKIGALCRRDDAPAAVIVPDRDDAPAPTLPGGVAWTAPSPLVIVENELPPQWHVIRGWVVAPCAARHQSSTLAKTGGR